MGHIGLGADALRFRVKSLSLDYYLGEEYARRGYMCEALGGLLRRLFLGRRGLLLLFFFRLLGGELVPQGG